MMNFFIDIYFGDKLLEKANLGSFIPSVMQQSLIYVIIAIAGLYIFFVIFTFILPYFRRNPKILYTRYLQVKERLEEVDNLYTLGKLSFEDYTYSQFNYTKELELIIKQLSKFSDYKSKISSYTVSYSKKLNLDKKEDDIRVIDFLFELLFSQAKYYNKEEIRQAILDEGFSKDISDAVTYQLEKAGAKFNSEGKVDNNKVVNFINQLFGKDNTTINANNNSISKNTENKKEISASNTKDTAATISNNKNLNQKPITVTSEKLNLTKIKELPK
ncbi:MAG: hypothetical protein V1824_01455, partial [archaeon]